MIQVRKKILYSVLCHDPLNIRGGDNSQNIVKYLRRFITSNNYLIILFTIIVSMMIITRLIALRNPNS
jgi:hypothetical protein